jgi:hypothetical protein
MLTALNGESCRIDDSRSDPRLLGHTARNEVLSYYAVHLLDPEGGSWGTLCHFDFTPRRIPDEAIRILEAVRPVVQEALWTGRALGSQR